MNMRNEIQKELIDAIIPFWEALRDDEYGGFYGYMTSTLIKRLRRVVFLTVELPGSSQVRIRHSRTRSF